MRTIKIFAALLLLAPVMAFAQLETYDLQQLKGFAEQYNETIAMNRTVSKQAQFSLDAAASTRLPRVDLTGSYSHVSEVGKIEFAIPGFLQRSISFGDGNIYDLTLSASVPLYTGSRISSSIEIQKQNMELAAQTLSGSILDIRNAVTRYYHLALLARKQAAVFSEQERLQERNLSTVRAFFQQGQSLAVDTLQLSTRLLQIRLDESTSMSQYRNAILMLMQLTGKTVEFDIRPDVPVASDVEGRTAGELAETAYASRYELKNLATSKKMNAFSTDALKAAYLPSVYAMAALRYGRPGVDQVKNEWMDYYTAGLRFEWNLLAWGGDKYNIEKQTLETEKLDLRESQLRSQLRTQISSIMNDLSLLKQTMSLLEQQIRQEQLKQDLVRARLQEGLATATEVVDAETSCTGALLRMEQTKIQYSMKLAELAATVGNPS